MNALHRHEIAARLRALLAGQDDGDLARAAARLGVQEASLARSLNEQSPDPSIEVMAAFIAAYGVDATWLVTGTYDAATHRHVLEGDTRSVGDVIRKLTTGGPTKPIAEPTEEKGRPRID
jgi:transcriptional regulator with XRE-family HTH domain